MNFIEYLEDIGYPQILLNEVVENKNKYTYDFKSKGKWQIAPKWELKILQKILKDYLTKSYSKFNISNNATAYIKGKNISYNVDRHQGNSYFFTTDFKNFFPSISESNIKHKLVTLLNKETEQSISYILKIIFYNEKLQYGFPTSPIISNFVMKAFDDILQKNLETLFSKNNNLQYTRYSDDITISSRYKIDKQNLEQAIKSLIDDKYTYLKFNEKKTRFFEKYAKRPHITGLIPLEKRNTIGKKKYNQIKLNIHLLINNSSVNNDILFDTIKSLSSYLSYLYLVDTHSYNRLKNSFISKFRDNENFNKIFFK